jgi:hypothetical protein
MERLLTPALQGVALNYAVAMAEGHTVVKDRIGNWIIKFKDPDTRPTAFKNFNAEGKWRIAGPIQARMKINLICVGGNTWKASSSEGDVHVEYSENPLQALMRCYVSMKLGFHVDVPKDLIYPGHQRLVEIRSKRTKLTLKGAQSQASL